MLRFLIQLPAVVWLLFPPGICLCDAVGMPEPGSKPSAPGMPIQGHAPWCTACKGEVAVESPEDESLSVSLDLQIADLALERQVGDEISCPAPVSPNWDAVGYGLPPLLASCRWLK